MIVQDRTGRVRFIGTLSKGEPQENQASATVFSEISITYDH
jgi:hypothetical protein